MSLQTAILALTPALYWRLNEASGSTTVADSAGGGFPGTVTGDIGLGAFGPELDRTSARIFTTGVIQSPNWGATVWNAFSVMFMATFPANGQPTSNVPFMGLGDSNNPTGRFRITQASTSINNLLISPFNVAASMAGAAPVQPIQVWHHYVWQYLGATLGWRWIVDGVTGTTQGTTLANPPVSTDRWWIKSDSPIVISDLAVFARAITPVEAQTVSSQVQLWPYQVPINTPIPIDDSNLTIPPATVDLTPVLTQTTQILNNQAVTDPIVITDVPQILTTTNTIHTQTTTIQTDTQNIVTTLFPQLATVINDLGLAINDVQNAVRGTISDGAAELVRTVGELLSNLNRDHLAQVSLTGGPTCSPVHLDVSGSRIYGIIVTITAYPDDWKFRTPDAAWSLKDLAVLRIYHYGQLLERHGVHTIRSTYEPIPQRGLPWLGPLVPLQPDGTIITVDWADGVCGEVTATQISS